MKKTEFDQFAESYSSILDEGTRLAGEESGFFDSYKLQCLVNWVVPRDRALEILDYGCGIGSLASMVADRFPSSTIDGVDISARSIEIARGRSSETSNLSFFEAPPNSKTYDVIYAANVFHHVSRKDQAELLRSLKLLLKPKGRIAVFEHNPWNPLTQYVVRTCPFDAEGVDLISKPSFARMARSVGLDVEIARYIVFFPHFLRFLRPLEPSLGFLPLGAQYLIVMTSPQSA